MDNRDDTEKQWSQLIEKIRDIKFTMLTTANQEGSLRSCPMVTLEASEAGTLWFLTGQSHRKARDIESNPKVNLAYVAGDKDTFVSVSGECSLVEDPAKIKALWNPFMRAWFPKGFEDPEVGLLRVDVEEAEYWDVTSKKMTTLIRFVKALAGSRNKDETTGHGILHPRDGG